MDVISTFWLFIALLVLLRLLVSTSSTTNTTTATIAGMSTNPKDLYDVYHTAFILRQKLPPELVPSILDFAEYWVKSSASCTYHMNITEQDLRVGSGSSSELKGTLYHTSPLIAGNYEQFSALNPVRKIVFTITSKDQGWSSYPECYGTYENSWTWFEAEVLDWNEGDTARWIPPRRICTNVHAGRDYKTHVTTWAWDSEDEHERMWIRRLRRGSKIGINVWARFPGWSNSVHSANIDIYTAAIR